MELNEYVKENKGIVLMLASKYYDKYANYFEKDDLIQVALLSLVESFYTYDDTKASMSTYVYNSANYSLMTYTCTNSYITYAPAGVILSSIFAGKEKSKYELLENRKITLTELREALSTKKYNKYLLTDKYLNTLLEMAEFHMKSEALPITFDTILDENGCPDINCSIEIQDNSSDIEYISNLRFDINNILDKFEKKDRFIIQRAFGLDGKPSATLTKIASELNVSNETVCRHYKKVLRKLYCKLKQWDD